MALSLDADILEGAPVAALGEMGRGADEVVGRGGIVPIVMLEGRLAAERERPEFPLVQDFAGLGVIAVIDLFRRPCADRV